MKPAPTPTEPALWHILVMVIHFIEILFLSRQVDILINVIPKSPIKCVTDMCVCENLWTNLQNLIIEKIKYTCSTGKYCTNRKGNKIRKTRDGVADECEKDPICEFFWLFWFLRIWLQMHKFRFKELRQLRYMHTYIRFVFR